MHAGKLTSALFSSIESGNRVSGTLLGRLDGNQWQNYMVKFWTTPNRPNFYHSQMKFGDRVIFSQLFVCPWGGWGLYPVGSLSRGSLCPGGLCLCHKDPPPHYSGRAGCKHHSGMLSFLVILREIIA